MYKNGYLAGRTQVSFAKDAGLFCVLISHFKTRGMSRDFLLSGTRTGPFEPPSVYMKTGNNRLIRTRMGPFELPSDLHAYENPGLETYEGRGGRGAILEELPPAGASG